MGKMLKGFRRRGMQQKNIKLVKRSEFKVFWCFLSIVWKNYLISILFIIFPTQIICMVLDFGCEHVLPCTFVSMLGMKSRNMWTLSMSATTELASPVWHVYFNVIFVPDFKAKSLVRESWAYTWLMNGIMRGMRF